MAEQIVVAIDTDIVTYENLIFGETIETDLNLTISGSGDNDDGTPIDGAHTLSCSLQADDDSAASAYDSSIPWSISLPSQTAGSDEVFSDLSVELSACDYDAQTLTIEGTVSSGYTADMSFSNSFTLAVDYVIRTPVVVGSQS
jgi:hypothetical protein